MNKLNAHVVSMDVSSHLCALRTSVGTDMFELILVEAPLYTQGDTVILVFKETEVILLKQPYPLCSANVHRATIKGIEVGMVLTSITLSYQQTTIVSLITTSAYNRLELLLDDDVLWMVQPSEISLLRGADGV